MVRATAALALAIACSPALAQISKPSNDNEAYREIVETQKSGQVFIVVFKMQGCHHCDRMESGIRRLSEEVKVIVVQRELCPYTARHFQVSVYPTVSFRGQREPDKIRPGYMSYQELSSWVKKKELDEQ